MVTETGDGSPHKKSSDGGALSSVSCEATSPEARSEESGLLLLFVLHLFMYLSCLASAA